MVLDPFKVIRFENGKKDNENGYTLTPMFVNVGTAPAINTEIYRDFSILPKGETPDFKPKIIPGLAAVVGNQKLAACAGVDITDEVIDKIIQNNSVMWFYQYCSYSSLRNPHKKYVTEVTQAVRINGFQTMNGGSKFPNWTGQLKGPRNTIT